MRSMRGRWSGVLIAKLAFAPADPAQVEAPPPPPAPAARSFDLDSLPLAFEPNAGQVGAAAKFLARTAAGTVFFDTCGATFAAGPHGAWFRMSLEGARASEPEGEARLPGTVNHFRGADPALWHVGLPTFARLRCRDVYPGIDLVFYGDGRQLEYDFEVSPGADPSAIRVAFENADGLRLGAEGGLELAVGHLTVTQAAPLAYQRSAS